MRFEMREAARAAAYFLVMAALAFAIGLIPFVGPVLAALWAAYALSFQLTDPPLTRRGLSFREKRAWHRTHRAESEGFGLAGLVLLLVPFANLLLGPAMAAGGALLVHRVEAHQRR
jgi:CysZ protein